VSDEAFTGVVRASECTDVQHTVGTDSVLAQRARDVVVRAAFLEQENR